jgi:hypothetical protein
MSDEIHWVTFSKGALRLQMNFVGDDYHGGATVTFKLEAMKTAHGVLEESVTIPVENLFDMTYLIGMCVRRTAAQYETEVQEMVDRLEQKKHPFEHIGGKNGKKDKKETKNK